MKTPALSVPPLTFASLHLCGIRIFICLYLCFTGVSLKAAEFTFSANCIAAQEHIFALRFDQARTYLDAEKNANPGNQLPLLLENYIDFLRNSIDENPELYKQTKGNEATRLTQLKQSPVKSPWYQYTQAEIQLQWAFVKLKMGDNIAAGSDIRDAYKLLKKNAADYPNFKLNGKSLGLIEALIGTVPEQYNWLVKLLGFNGNINEGAAKVAAYLNSTSAAKEDVYFKLEAAFVYAMIQHHILKDNDKAWMTVEPYTRDYKTNMLQNYIRAFIAGYAGRNDDVIEIISAKPAYSVSYPFYFMDYLLGAAMLKKLDTGADIHFKVYVVKHPGRSYIKSAYRYLAWSSLIQGRTTEYKTYCSLCSKKGAAVTEEDKQAAKEASADDIPNVDLLKGRLLFDGKYYSQAFASLQKVKEETLPGDKQKLELNYRYARLYHERKQYTEARAFYQITIQKGKNQPYYFAAYSALQLGFICETEKQTELAATYFNMAKNDFPKNKEYVSSIEQKAKAGLKRLGK